MVRVTCSWEGCTYKTEDMEAEMAVKLLTIHDRQHQHEASGNATCKVKRPVMASSRTSEDWRYFLQRWGDYKKATGVRGEELVLQLLECCDETLRRDLCRNAGDSLATRSESDVIAAIKLLAVREENTMIARVALHQLKQDRDEPVRTYGARLRGLWFWFWLILSRAPKGASMSLNAHTVRRRSTIQTPSYVTY